MDVALTEHPTDAKPQQKSRGKLFWLFLDAVAILFWLYAVTKLFIFDIDVFLVSYATPEFVWLLNYKFLILLGVVLAAMLITRSATVGMMAAYVAIYPLVTLLWKFPRFVWKQKSWLFAFAILNAAIGTVRSFKRVFVSGSLFLIAAALIWSTSNKAILYGSAIVLFALVVLGFTLAFLRAFRPSAIFQAYTKLFPAIKKGDFLKADVSIKDIPIESMTDKQLELRTTGIQNVVLYNRACLFISKKLRDYQRSGANVAASTISLVTLLFFTIIAFALINYALFKADPGLYQFTFSKETLFSFVYYSAGSMFYAANGLVPTGPLSQLVHLIQFLCGVLLLVIFITVVVSLRNERYSRELGEVIASLKKEGANAESLLSRDFDLADVRSAIEALQSAKAGLIGAIIYLTKNLDDDFSD